MKIYISGPVTGIKDNNEPAFERAELALKALGHEPTNPVKLCKEQGLTEWNACMALCIPEVAKCEAIIFLEGWEWSRGALEERSEALRLGLDFIDIDIN